MGVYLRSTGYKWGMNFGIDCVSGTLKGRNGQEIVIRNGEVVRQVTNYQKRTVTTWGKHIKTYNAEGQLLRIYYFQPGTDKCRIKTGLATWERQQIDGVGLFVKVYTSGGGLYRKKAKYANGRLCYEFTRRNKAVTIYRSNGKVWAEIKSDSVPQQLYNYNRWYRQRQQSGETGLPVFRHFSSINNGSIVVYDVEGSVQTQAVVENRQLTDKMILNGIEKWLLSGVPVTKQLYEGEFNEVTAHEILDIENSQLRAALLKKLTFDKLLEYVKPKIIDQTDEMVLMHFEPNEKSRNRETVAILKVVCPSTGSSYLLRVPPHEWCNNCEKARHWTFGKGEGQLVQNVLFEFNKET